jgi:hypothetical protein
MSEIAIARSNGDRGGKKKKGSMSSVESKPDKKLKKKREKGNERNFFSTNTMDQEKYYEMLIYMRIVKCKKRAK